MKNHDTARYHTDTGNQPSKTNFSRFFFTEIPWDSKGEFLYIYIDAQRIFFDRFFDWSMDCKLKKTGYSYIRGSVNLNRLREKPSGR